MTKFGLAESFSLIESTCYMFMAGVYINLLLNIIFSSSRLSLSNKNRNLLASIIVV